MSMATREVPVSSQVTAVISTLLHSDSADKQTISPDCPRYENNSDWSQPVWSSSCNNGLFWLVNKNSTDLRECFRSSIHYYGTEANVVEGHLTFDMTNAVDCNGSCFCNALLQGPHETHFDFEITYKGNYDPSILNLEPNILVTVDPDFHIASGSTTNNQLFLRIFIDEKSTENTIATIRFHAVLECEEQLQVRCSPTGGYIQTPGWNDAKQYANEMDSCITLQVPESHVIMISLVSIDVEMEDNGAYCYDQLIICKGERCCGDEEEICEGQDLPPTVLTGIPAVSFRFKSDGSKTKTGFRLLYSFHNSSKVPYKLSDGKWDCSVPYYESFKKHFVCLPDVFCSDKKDKIRCPEDDVCGSNLVKFEESCYRFFEPSLPTTWYEATDTCSNYGGHLAILNSAQELDNVMEFIKRRKMDGYVFIGLRMAPSSKLPEKYQYTWMWSDNSLAVYYDIKFAPMDSPYCAAVNCTNQTLTMITCDKETDAAFLCGTDFSTFDHAQDNTTISLHTPSSGNMKNMATCQHNHFTHTFLACDVSTNCSAVKQKESLVCSSKFSPPVPFFTCRNQERVPYTLVCDFRFDCCDGSDEDFCKFPACESRKYFQCADRKQCIFRKHVCDKRSDCVDSSDELKCHQGLIPSELMSNTVQPPAQIDFTGYGNFTVTPLLNFSCPETHFLCPGKGYCLPVYVRCNDVYDCPGWEDEMDCNHYTCPGFYRCRQSKICLHKDHLCDGVFQCPQHDDELTCNLTCPENCHCYGYAFICTANFIAKNYPELRYLDAVDTEMKPEDLLNNIKLIHLNLRNCGITVLGELDFPNLRSLDLTKNNLQELRSSHLYRLRNLVSLSLAYNPLMILTSLLYSELKFPKIITLNLSGILIQEINDSFFTTFPDVQYLNLSDTGLKNIPQTGFQSLNSLHMLDLRGCPMDTFFHGMFEGLNHLNTIYTDNYKLCCPTVLPQEIAPENCHAPTDEVSSCDALLRSDVFRVFLALYAFLALIGNLGSFVYRVFFEGGAIRTGYEVFVTHLSVADFLMGVYLAIIGISDRIYYGNYKWNDTIWKHSVACMVAGFLSLVSSEVSAYVICLITLERLLVIGFPHKNLRFSRWPAHAACMVAWLIGLTLALIPLLPITSHWQFYSQTGICIPLPITRKQFDGSDYAFAIMIVVNFVLFLFIAVGQLLIYWSIRLNRFPSKDCKRKSQDTVIARRLLTVVMTDFLYWFPIGLLALMARIGVPISGEANVAIAIFVLPFNSALNPFLYTLNIMMERRHKVYQGWKSREEGRKPCSSYTSTRVFDVKMENRKQTTSLRKDEAFQLFSKFLDDDLITLAQVRHHLSDIYEG